MVFTNVVTPIYRYAAIITRVIDGDTLQADIDLGFSTWIRSVSIRIRGINCPEMSTPNGLVAKRFTEDALLNKANGTTGPAQVVVDTVKVDKYGGRWDAYVWLPDGRSLGDMLLQSGNAVPMKAATEGENP